MADLDDHRPLDHDFAISFFCDDVKITKAETDEKNSRGDLTETRAIRDLPEASLAILVGLALSPRTVFPSAQLKVIGWGDEALATDAMLHGAVGRARGVADIPPRLYRMDVDRTDVDLLVWDAYAMEFIEQAETLMMKPLVPSDCERLIEVGMRLHTMWRSDPASSFGDRPLAYRQFDSFRRRHLRVAQFLIRAILLSGRPAQAATLFDHYWDIYADAPWWHRHQKTWNDLWAMVCGSISHDKTESYGWAETGELFEALMRGLEGWIPDVILGINRGGSIVGGFIAKRFAPDSIALQLIHVAPNAEAGHYEVDSSPDLAVPGAERVLMADDGFRRGWHSAAARREVVAMYPDADVKFAVLVEHHVDQPGNSGAEHPPDFFGVRNSSGSFRLPWDLPAAT